MEHILHTLYGQEVDVYTVNTLVVGSGAAGCNAAHTLHTLGQTDIAILTQGLEAGTSMESCADKQAYYKLSMWSHHPDSVEQMSADLMERGCMDGDLATCEAAMSPQCFAKLCALGIPFPTNRFGEYIGFQSDNDTAFRATTAGPRTARLITTALQKEIGKAQIPVFEGYQVVAVLAHKGEARGVLGYSPTADRHYILFNCTSVIYATGGSGGIFAHSAYPDGQIGATGAALEAGAGAVNLTEWQFGITALDTKVKMSGSYFQVLPRLYSVDETGAETEFLWPHFRREGDALNALFCKGHQWPFDVTRLKDTSLIDLLVYQESVLRGRKVYMDFTRNPKEREPRYDQLGVDQLRFVKGTGLTSCPTPADRLIQLNQPAFDLFLSKGIDLRTTPVEIGVCAQHNLGGLVVDLWWQSNLKGMFPCGEVAGTHGVSAPGGSSLNAGQVGSTRAATYIVTHRNTPPQSVDALLADCGETLEQKIGLATLFRGDQSPDVMIKQAKERMSRACGCIKEKPKVEELMELTYRLLKTLPDTLSATTPEEIGKAYTLHEILLCQLAHAQAVYEYILIRDSRGGSLISRPQGTLPEGMDKVFTHRLDDEENFGFRQELLYQPQKGTFICGSSRVKKRPVGPERFENIWRGYQQDQNISYLQKWRPLVPGEPFWIHFDR